MHRSQFKDEFELASSFKRQSQNVQLGHLETRYEHADLPESPAWGHQPQLPHWHEPRHCEVLWNLFSKGGHTLPI